MKRITIFLCLFALFTSCLKIKTDKTEFPAETQKGLNTFGCYIDDVAFLPSTTLYGNVSPINVHYATDSSNLYSPGFLSIQGIDARYTLDIAGSLGIQKIQVFGVGEYPLTHTFNCIKPYTCDAGGYYNSKENKTYFIENGKLTITRFDTINKIISGRFYFTVKDTLGNRKTVKNGVFDTHY